MDEKTQFINAMLKAEKPFKHICADFGISEKTGHKWKKRFYEDGKSGLLEKSCSPDIHPNALSEDTIIDLIALKSAHPFWGTKKIRQLYAKAHCEHLMNYIHHLQGNTQVIMMISTTQLGLNTEKLLAVEKLSSMEYA